MKNRRLIPLFVSASLFSALSFSTFSPVSAQPAPGAAQVERKARKKGAGAKRAKRGGLPKRMMEKIEEKMGKPLTDAQKTRLGAAHKTRLAAAKAAQEKFNQETVTVTGLSLEEVQSLNKRGKAAGKMAPAAR